MTAFDSLVECNACGHGAGYHDGSGCGMRGCGCPGTKESVMGSSIELMWQEDRQRFARAEPLA